MDPSGAGGDRNERQAVGRDHGAFRLRQYEQRNRQGDDDQPRGDQDSGEENGWGALIDGVGVFGDFTDAEGLDPEVGKLCQIERDSGC